VRFKKVLSEEEEEKRAKEKGTKDELIVCDERENISRSTRSGNGTDIIFIPLYLERA
jgi:hypothetical protein